MNPSQTAPLTKPRSTWKTIGSVLLALSGLALGAVIGLIIGVFTGLIPFAIAC
jgi:ABC-type nitrate/sulfonate/bicarbonate transport system permease component